jgi:polysaccharide deacetylase family protein (PEP-CTERM system associated)
MNILTFDIEEWFHLLEFAATKYPENWNKYPPRIHENLGRILDFLDEKNLKATFFCLGWIAQKYPQEIKEIAKRGQEVGAHSNNHRLVYELGVTRFGEDTKNAINNLENLTGKKVVSYRAPRFSLTDQCKWAFEILAENGIERDSSIYPASRSLGGFPELGKAGPAIIKVNGITIKEFPISINSIFGKNLVFSGGGYFRLIPYRLIRRWTEQSNYVMTYFHPRDFDPGQPRIQGIPMQRRFRSYVGLATSFSKFQTWINDFSFVDLDTADKLVNWDSVKTIIISE